MGTKQKVHGLICAMGNAPNSCFLFLVVLWEY